LLISRQKAPFGEVARMLPQDGNRINAGHALFTTRVSAASRHHH
jgi:hypothetical protein